jgi:hypothetical protein
VGFGDLFVGEGKEHRGAYRLYAKSQADMSSWMAALSAVRNPAA